MPFSGVLCRVLLVRSDDLDDRRFSIIRVTRICEIRTTLAVTSNGSTLYCHPDDGINRFLRIFGYYKSHRVTSQKMAFFIVTAVKTSSLT
jgi:hypothetical protein